MTSENEARWKIGDTVQKKRGSSWRGTVCGFYSTPHTPIGYCVDSAFEPGSVQVWPEAALEDWSPQPAEQDERGRIVAWLRSALVPDHCDCGGCPADMFANAIEAGQHLKEPGNG
ncbi:MAG: hypothetical protein QM681_18270 [Novosphingobium sp.]